MKTVIGISAIALLMGVTSVNAHTHHRKYASAHRVWLQPDSMGPGEKDRYATRIGDQVDNGSPYPNRIGPDGGLTGPIARSAHGG